MNSGAIGGIAASVLVPLIFVLFKKIFPNQLQAITQDQFMVMEKKFKKWEQFSVIPFFIFTGLLTFFFYFIFSKFTVLYFNTISPHVFILVSIYKLFLLIPSFFMGMIFAYFPLDVLYRLILKEKYQSYETYSHYRIGFNSNKLKPIGIILVILCLLSSVMFIDTYTVIYDNSIGVNNFFSFSEKRFKYEEIDKIESFYSKNRKSGVIAKTLKYQILFKNGKQWNSTQSLRDPLITDSEVIKYIQDKSGIKIDYIGIK